MKNPIVAASVITAILLLVIVGVVQFVVGPSSAQTKEALLNGYLSDFNNAHGKISAQATTDEALQAVCGGKGSPSVTIPQDYAAKGVALSPCYNPEYDAASNTFKVSFSLIRFVTEKPYLAGSVSPL